MSQPAAGTMSVTAAAASTETSSDVGVVHGYALYATGEDKPMGIDTKHRSVLVAMDAKMQPLAIFPIDSAPLGDQLLVVMSRDWELIESSLCDRTVKLLEELIRYTDVRRGTALVNFLALPYVSVFGRRAVRITDEKAYLKALEDSEIENPRLFSEFAAGKSLPTKAERMKSRIDALFLKVAAGQRRFCGTKKSKRSLKVLDHVKVAQVDYGFRAREETAQELMFKSAEDTKRDTSADDETGLSAAGSAAGDSDDEYPDEYYGDYKGYNDFSDSDAETNDAFGADGKPVVAPTVAAAPAAAAAGAASGTSSSSSPTKRKFVATSKEDEVVAVQPSPLKRLKVSPPDAAVAPPTKTPVHTPKSAAPVLSRSSAAAIAMAALAKNK